MKFDVIIPARAGSKRFPKKNIVLWKYTRDFLLKNRDMFGDVYVSTDSEELGNIVKGDGFNFVRRCSHLSIDDMSVTPVVQDVVAKKNLYEKDLCMMYLTSPERQAKDYQLAKKIYENQNLESLISFYKPEYSPYLARYGDTMEPLINHNLYRYQDYRDIIILTHYICFFKGTSLHKLDNQLYGEGLTKSYLLDYIPVDIDYEVQLQKWKLEKH